MNCSHTVVAQHLWIRAVVKNVLVPSFGALHRINVFILTACC